jgi:hypothetical protein
LTNLDEFFGDERSKNVDTLVEVTKKFFIFVSQLAEIVDELERNFAELNLKVDQLLQGRSTGPSKNSIQFSAPVQPSSTRSSPPSISQPPSFPNPPTPMQASPQTPPAISPLSPPSPSSISPSSPNLPPLPGQIPSSSPPPFGSPPPSSSSAGFEQIQPPGPGINSQGAPGIPGPGVPAPRPSPMSLKAQMNMELKEAFARIRKGWDEEG